MGNKEYRKRHREHGICEACTDKAMPGRIYCVKHLIHKASNTRKWRIRNKSKQIEYDKNRRNRYREEGKCTACGIPLLKEDKIQGYVKCENCRVHITGGIK